MDKIILGIVQALLCPEYVKDEQHFGVTHAAEVLYRKVMAMPIVLRCVMFVYIYMFNAWGIVVGGGLFQNLDLVKRQVVLRQWQNSSIGSCREGMAFFIKMTFFIHYSLCSKNV